MDYGVLSHITATFMEHGGNQAPISLEIRQFPEIEAAPFDETFRLLVAHSDQWGSLYLRAWPEILNRPVFRENNGQLNRLESFEFSEVCEYRDEEDDEWSSDDEEVLVLAHNQFTGRPLSFGFLGSCPKLKRVSLIVDFPANIQVPFEKVFCLSLQTYSRRWPLSFISVFQNLTELVLQPGPEYSGDPPKKTPNVCLLSQLRTLHLQLDGIGAIQSHTIGTIVAPELETLRLDVFDGVPPIETFHYRKASDEEASVLYDFMRRCPHINTRHR